MANGWTIETLKEYILRLLDEHYRHHSNLETHVDQLRLSQRNELNIAIKSVEDLQGAAIEASRQAVMKVEQATDKRFDSVNEFRATLSEQAAKFITRKEHEALIARMDDLTNRLNLTIGRGVGLNAGWVYLIAAVGAASALISIIMGFIKH